MNAKTLRKLLLPTAVAAALAASASASAAVFVQCPGDTNGNGQIDGPGTGYSAASVTIASTGGGTGATANAIVTNGSVTGFTVTSQGSGYTAGTTLVTISDPTGRGATATATVSAGKVTALHVGTAESVVPGKPYTCKHLSAGDGFISMADSRSLYSFGFAEVTGKAPSDVMLDLLAANFAAPTIELKEGDDFYLSLTNVAMALRPDLFDPHTVHFHGFPQQPPVFDGMPEGSFGVNMGSTVTYFYRLNDPGTYMYHCHQEATEHMQMGMLGNLYVKPLQDGTAKTYAGKTYSRFVYNDRDGSTGYDVAKPLQLGSMDHVFHELHLGVQPLPFKYMKDSYAMINGRGYPDTVNPAPLPPPPEKADFLAPQPAESSQPVNALVNAKKGDRILLRLSNLNVTNYYTVTAQGLPMKVVGMGARQLRGAEKTANANDGLDLYYDTTSVTLGGGESAEVMIDTSDVAAGTYFLYSTNLNFLSNFQEDSGGMMTEIVIAP